MRFIYGAALQQSAIKGKESLIFIGGCSKLRFAACKNYAYMYETIPVEDCNNCTYSIYDKVHLRNA